MTRQARTTLVGLSIAGAIVGFVIALAWWTLFHNRIREGVIVLDSHHEQIEAIRRIATANGWLRYSIPSRECSKGALDRITLEKNRDDYSKICDLMSQSFVDRVTLFRDQHGTLWAIELDVFDEGFSASAPPIVGVWVTPGWTFRDVGVANCRPIRLSRWSACETKWLFL